MFDNLNVIFKKKGFRRCPLYIESQTRKETLVGIFFSESGLLLKNTILNRFLLFRNKFLKCVEPFLESDKAVLKD